MSMTLNENLLLTIALAPLAGSLIAGLFGSYSGLTMFYLILGALWCAATLSGSLRTAAAAERAATTGKL